MVAFDPNERPDLDDVLENNPWLGEEMLSI